MLKEGRRGRAATRTRTMIIINVACSLQLSSLSLSFSPVLPTLVLCVPCWRFLWSVASFVHLNTSRLDAEWSERRRTERDRTKRTHRQGGNKTGKGCSDREGERGNNDREKQRERVGFAMRGEKRLECPGKISSGPTKGKVRFSSLQTSPSTFNFLPRIQRFLFTSLFLPRFCV